MTSLYAPSLYSNYHCCLVYQANPYRIGMNFQCKADRFFFLKEYPGPAQSVGTWNFWGYVANFDRFNSQRSCPEGLLGNGFKAKALDHNCEGCSGYIEGSKPFRSTGTQCGTLWKGTNAVHIPASLAENSDQVDQVAENMFVSLPIRSYCDGKHGPPNTSKGVPDQNSLAR